MSVKLVNVSVKVSVSTTDSCGLGQNRRLGPMRRWRANRRKKQALQVTQPVCPCSIWRVGAAGELTAGLEFWRVGVRGLGLHLDSSPSGKSLRMRSRGGSSGDDEVSERCWRERGLSRVVGASIYSRSGRRLAAPSLVQSGFRHWTRGPRRCNAAVVRSGIGVSSLFHIPRCRSYPWSLVRAG